MRIAIIVGRSSPASICVSAPPDLKKCMVNAVGSPALRVYTLSAFVISVADKGIFPPNGYSRVRCWEIFGKGYLSVMFQPSADCSSYRARGHTLSVAFYGHGMIGAASHQLSPLKLKRRPRSFGGLNMRCMSVRLSPSPRFVVLNATVNRAMSLSKLSYRKGPVWVDMCTMIAVRWL